MIAHQRVIRDQRATAAAADNLFGAWWQDVDVDIRRAVVRPVSYETARTIILEYEWLGTMPAVVSHSFGIFFEGNCGGVVCYGPEYGENLGVWDRYGYTGKILALLRGACVHWAHPHAGSKLIRRSMDLLPRQYEVVTATVDARAGEIGTLYQACGFHYVGWLRTTPNGSAQPRLEITAPHWAKPMRDRQARQVYGTLSVPALRAQGLTVEVLPSPGRYFAFRGSVKQRKAHLAAIRPWLRTYPKRVSLSNLTRTEDMAMLSVVEAGGGVDRGASPPAARSQCLNSARPECPRAEESRCPQCMTT